MSGSDIFTGTLDILLLRMVSHGPLHGYAIRRALDAVSDGVLDIEEGALYHALHRLDGRGLLKASWGQSETGRRVKFYELTEGGRDHLAERVTEWHRVTEAVGKVLGGATC